MSCVSKKKVNNVNTNYESLSEMNTADSIDKTRYKGLQPYVIKQLKTALCLTVGNLTTGYSMCWSGLAPQLKEPQTSDSDRNSLWIISALIGAIVGSNVFGYIANKIGRKPTLLIASCFNIVGFTILANAGEVTLLVGRGMVGVASGSIIVLNVVYLGEIASSNIRGALTTLTGISQLLGNLLLYSIAPYISMTAVYYVGICISCVHTLALCYITESPVYQIMKGEYIDAKLTLHNLRRTKDTDEELKPITKNINETLLPPIEDNLKTRAPFWLTGIILKKENQKAFLITAILFCIQVGGGVTTVISFAMTIFRNAHSSVDPNVGVIILGLTELSGLVMTPLLIERYGRRILLLISLGCCSLCMGILGTYFYLEVNHYMMIHSIRWLPLVLLMTCLFMFNIGLSIVPNTLSGEMYSPPMRTIGSCMSISLAWSVALVMGSKSNHIVAILRNHGIFWLYSGINTLGFVFTLVFVPETKGKSLAEISYLLDR